MLEDFRKKIARLIAPKMAAPKTPKAASRIYHAAEGDRLTQGWRSSRTSSDTELRSSLLRLRGRSRALVRDVGYAKRAKVIVINNVIGSGMKLQAQVKNQRKTLQDDINDDIEEAFDDWSYADSCHTGGVLCFADMERLAMGQVFEAGEIFIRKHYSKFGDSEVPLALEVIEPERIAEEFLIPVTTPNELRMGIEVDNFYRPLAYWVRDRHPGDLRTSAFTVDQYRRIPANQMIHLYICDRWPQTRGEPWLHAVARRLNDMDGYSEAEIVAARGAANFMAARRTPDTDPLTPDSTQGDQRLMNLEPGIIEQLLPGEEMQWNNPNRPNPNLDPFMRYMLREVAAGTGSSYESLSRDYSQSNYSSSRLAALDDRDLWRVFQQWFIRNFREPLHREFVELAVLSRAVSTFSIDEYSANPKKFEAVTFKPRGWSWVDPTREVEAYTKAVRSGFTTISDVIALTGQEGDDLEDVLKKRARELEIAKELGLVFDTDPAQVPAATAASANPGSNPAAAAPAATPPQDPAGNATAGQDGSAGDAPSAEDQAASGRVVPMRAGR